MFFERRYVVDFIRRYMMNELKAPRALGYDEILEAVEVQQGIIVARATDVYSFSHLTIQEYLAAYQIHNSGTGEQCVAQHLTEERWREVILLLAGMAKADRLLKAGIGTVNSLAAVFPLASILEWVERAPGGTPGRISRLYTLMSVQFALAAIPPDTAADVTEAFDVGFNRLRTMATALSGRDSISGDLLQLPREVLGRWEGYGVEYAFLAIQRSRAVLQAAVRNGAMASTFDFGVLERIEQLLPVRTDDAVIRSALSAELAILTSKIAESLGCPERLLTMTLNDVKKVSEYLHAINVLIEFKQSALRLSPQVWDVFARSVLQRTTIG